MTGRTVGGNINEKKSYDYKQPRRRHEKKMLRRRREKKKKSQNHDSTGTPPIAPQ